MADRPSLTIHQPGPLYYRLYAVAADARGTAGGVPLSNPIRDLTRAVNAGLQTAADPALKDRVRAVVPGATAIVLNDDQGHEVRRWPILGVAVQPEARAEKGRRRGGPLAMLLRWLRWG